jgi:hypothetical protein
MADLSGFVERQSASLSALNRRGIRKATRWTVNGRRYVRNFRVPPGSLIVPDPAGVQPMIDLLEAVCPAFTRAVDRQLVPAAMASRAQWPVDTGLSKSLLYLTYEQGPGAAPGRSGSVYVAKFGSGAPYTWFINRSASARRLIFAPGTRAAMTIARELFADPAFRG